MFTIGSVSKSFWFIIFSNITMRQISYIFYQQYMRGRDQYIGCSQNCLQKCTQNDQRSFERHKERHKVFQKESYLNKNQEYINKNKRYWRDAQDSIVIYFKNLFEKLQNIRTEVIENIESQRVGEAIGSDVPQNIVIAKRLLRQESQKLSCQDIYEFEQLKEKGRMNQKKLSILLNEKFKKIQEQIFLETKSIRQKYSYNQEIQKDERRQDNKTVNRNYRNERDLRDNRNHNENKRNNYRNHNKGKKPIYNDSKSEAPEDQKITLLKNIRQSGLFTVQVRIKKTIRILESNKGKKMLFIGEDQSGEERIVTKLLPMIAVGNLIRISNCSIYHHQNEKQISTRYESFYKLLQGEERKQRKDNRPNSRMQHKRNNRRFNDEKEEVNQNRNTPQQLNLNQVSLKEVGPGDENLVLNIKVIDIKQVGKNLDCVIGDQTALARALLPSSRDCIRVGQSLQLKNVEAEVRNQKIVIVASRQTRIDPNRKVFKQINLDNNISDTLWQQAD